MGRHFKVKTNHDSLKYFLQKILSSEDQQKWVTKILGYDFEIIYEKGKKNVVVDVGNNTERGGESVLSSQIFPFTNSEDIRYFS